MVSFVYSGIKQTFLSNMKYTLFSVQMKFLLDKCSLHQLKQTCVSTVIHFWTMYFSFPFQKFILWCVRVVINPRKAVVRCRRTFHFAFHGRLTDSCYLFFCLHASVAALHEVCIPWVGLGVCDDQELLPVDPILM